MPWPPNGDYYVFKEASIKAKAPNAAGVYGLYNIKHYVLIGESADIREALLRHERETSFLFGLYRPVGFTFEVCSPELRAERAQQLVAEYRPVLQGRNLFSFSRWRRESSNYDLLNSSDGAGKNGAAHEPTPVFIVENPKETDKRFYFSRDQVVALALAFAVTAVSIGFLGVLTGKQLEVTRIVKKETSQANIPVDPQAEAAGAEPDAHAGQGVSYFDPLANPDEQPTNEELSKRDKLRGSDVNAFSPEHKPLGREPTGTTAGKKTDGANESAIGAPRLTQGSAIGQPAKREEPVQTWTVQVKASVDKGSADVWADRLKTKGYNAFVVEADIHGRTWYRVRIGSFDTRQAAERLRKALETEEGFGDAYLVKN